MPDGKWTDLRLLIFTEYDDTKRYLVEILRAAIADTDLAEHRIAVYHGPTPPDKREEIRAKRLVLFNKRANAFTKGAAEALTDQSLGLTTFSLPL